MTTTQSTTPETRGARHALSIGHLVMGVAYLGLTVVWALVIGDVVEGNDVRFLLPAPWVLAGAAGLVALIVTDRRHHGSTATGWVGLEERQPEPEPHPQPDLVADPADDTSDGSPR
jgi:hypothetical protein